MSLLHKIRLFASGQQQSGTLKTWNWGYKGFLGLFLAGAMASLALPPIFFIPCLLPGLWLALAMANSAPTPRTAFYIGWCYGFGFYVFGLYWIAAALFTDIKQYWFFLPLSIVGLPAILSLFHGAAFYVWHRYYRKAVGASKWLGIALLLAAAEWLRGHVFTGFPWNLLGYSALAIPSLAQTASITGVYGLSLVLYVLIILPFIWLDKIIARTTRLLWFIAPALLLTGGLLWGNNRLEQAALTAENYPNIRLRLVQPNIAQETKWDQEKLMQHFKHLLALSVPDAPERGTQNIVIWPETAVPFMLETQDSVRQTIAKKIGTATLLAGAFRQEDPPLDAAGTLKRATPLYYNSMIALQGTNVVGHYDKSHLVPFGEYVPLRRYLPLSLIAYAPGDMAEGSGPTTISLEKLPSFSTLICYEAIFPGAVTMHGQRPDFLVNLTNDAWYGKTAGPHQHFHIARMRAIEEGLPLVRVANTGFSGIIDPVGNIVEITRLFEEVAIEAPLPKPLPATLYSRFGDALFLVIMLLFFVLGQIGNKNTFPSLFKK
ncbi:MAG: apolipoprotein N-acyltransferase [Alphaproteobacteria bacterium]